MHLQIKTFKCGGMSSILYVWLYSENSHNVLGESKSGVHYRYLKCPEKDIEIKIISKIEE